MKRVELRFPLCDLFSPFPWLPPVKSSRFNDLTFQRFHVVFASQTQSNPVQPNQAAPPPPGKQIGKETVKFLAIFAHPMRQLETGRDDFHVVPKGRARVRTEPAGARAVPARRIVSCTSARRINCPCTCLTQWLRAGTARAPVAVTRCPIRAGLRVGPRFGLNSCPLCIKNASLGLFEFELF